jgi:hypothetical protein
MILRNNSAPIKIPALTKILALIQKESSLVNCFYCVEFKCTNMDLMKKSLYVGNSTNVGKVVIALFYMTLLIES